MKIGIPRSLFYHSYYPFWTVFFASLGWEYQVSPKTDSDILKMGLTRLADEFCLPLKIHLGHMAYLSEKCEVLFSPGFGRCGKKGKFCPKLMAAPDIVGLKFPNAHEFWQEYDEDNLPYYQQWQKAVHSLDSSLATSVIKKAWRNAREAQERFFQLSKEGYDLCDVHDHIINAKPLIRREENAKIRLGILGRPYLVYDPIANHGIKDLLSSYGANIYTQEMVSDIVKFWPGQEKKVYWPVAQETLSAAYFYSYEQPLDGIIFLSSCLCGPDALIGELLERYMGRQSETMPLLKLTVDEHTGRAGLITRIEAFIDLLLWRKSHAKV